MASTKDLAFYESYSATFTGTVNGGEAETIAAMTSVIPSTSPRTILKKGHIDVDLGATAGDTVDLWPNSVAALASGTVIHFRLQFYFDTTDTTLAQKAITVKSGATPDIRYTWGTPQEFALGAVVAIGAYRVNNANAVCKIQGIWQIYTV